MNGTWTSGEEKQDCPEDKHQLHSAEPGVAVVVLTRRKGSTQPVVREQKDWQEVGRGGAEGAAGGMD